MNPLNETLRQAMSGMQLQSKRIGITAENISNADTPGYRRKVLVVDAPVRADARGAAAFQSTRVMLDETDGSRDFDPAHPMADAAGYVTQSNVSLVTELADIREAGRSYEANLNSFQQARAMYRSLLDLMRQ
jgi:flagellar basal-body rod protein FlgC